MSGVVAGLMLDRSISHSQQGTASAKRPQDVALYKSLWQDNHDGVARRGGFFYTGMIGNGITPRMYEAPSTTQKEIVDTGFASHAIILETILACLTARGHDVLACKLVAHATPHTSVPSLQHIRETLPKLLTNPRDVAVIKSFDDAKILWSVLLLASESPTTFCRCFDVFLSLFATVIGRWSCFKTRQNRDLHFSTMTYPEAVASSAEAHLAPNRLMLTANPTLLNLTSILLEIMRCVSLFFWGGGGMHVFLWVWPMGLTRMKFVASPFKFVNPLCLCSQAYNFI